MNRQKKQATLFQTWSNTPSTSTSKKSSHHEEIDLTEEITEEDLLMAEAVDISLAEYEAAQASTSKACQNVVSTTPIETIPGFDNEAGQTWIYPTNYPVRQYQFSIVEKALFKNTIVILPTGLGKTFIAAVVMYNYFRWYPRGKIVFMAPTKPLVAQQIEACFKIMGIPLNQSAEMTGSMTPENRRIIWSEKRVFFITPHIMNNDLARGICSANDVKLLVFDEAHKATKNYAFCQVINEVVKTNLQFRVLALSATPGTDLVTVKQVFQNLLIDHVELRTEESLDIRPYTFNRLFETVVVKMNENMKEISDGVLSVLSGYLERLKRNHVLYYQNAANMKQFILIKSREQFRQNLRPSMDKSRCNLIEADFSMAITICHAHKMLTIYGLRSFYTFIQEHIDGLKGYARSRSELLRNSTLTSIMDRLRSVFDTENCEIENDFVSHPKILSAEEIIKDHFTNFKISTEKDDQPNTRVMLFSAYRSSVDELTNILNKNRPLIRAMAFTGQASSSRSKGITQKEQIEIVKQFRSGGYNTLVSTCVGEEGLDIGDVDLIVCFDTYKSPIRLIQRIGRTGRKREGKVVLLTTEGWEEHIFDQSKAKAANIHKSICKENFRSLYPQNPRMVPRGLNPRCHKMHITVPTAYKRTGKKKKDIFEVSKNNLLTFLDRHTGKKSTKDKESNDDNDEEKKTNDAIVKKRGEIRKEVNQKPYRINKKQKKALILDDDFMDEGLMADPFEIKKGGEMEIIEEEDLDEMEKRESECFETENLETDHCDELDKFNSEDLNEFEDNWEMEDENYNLSTNVKNDVIDKNNGEFFSNTIDGVNHKVSLTNSAVRSPPSFNCVFSNSKEDLSMIDYEQVTESEQQKTVNVRNIANRPPESMGFEFPGINNDFTSPIKEYVDFDVPSSPIITSAVNVEKTDNLQSDDELDSFDNCLNYSTKNAATYSVTQLIDLVHENSMRSETLEESNETLKHIDKLKELELNGTFTRLRRKGDNLENADKVEKVNAKYEIMPNFDLNCDLNFDDDNSEDDIIPSSQDENKLFKSSKSVMPTVSFDLNVREMFQDSDNEIEASFAKKDFENKKKGLACKTSTPKHELGKKLESDNDSSFGWEKLPSVKSVKFQNNQKTNKNSRKRRLSVGFVVSQAQVAGDVSNSDDESESELDMIESSFIDDNTQAVDSSMTAVYLESLKDTMGPKKFKINPLCATNEIDMPQMTQDEYQHDSFCVASDEVELEESPENKNKGKKWKRIVNKSDSTLSLEEDHNKTIATDTSISKNDDGIVILIDSKEVNGSHQLISELRHQHKIDSAVVSLKNCDYIVSTRMGVERKLFSSIASKISKNNLVQRISGMMYLFDRTCLIIEADKEKLGMKIDSSCMYYNRLISALLQLPIKLLQSDSQADSARILKELALTEKRKGFGLSVDLKLPLSKKEEQLCSLYQKIPVVNYITALNLCRNTLSVQQLVNSSASVIQRKGNINESRANDIVNFIKRNFNS